MTKQSRCHDIGLARGGPVRTGSKRAYARHHCAMTGFLSFRGHEPGFQWALIYFCIGRRDVSVLVALAQEVNQIRNRCP